LGSLQLVPSGGGGGGEKGAGAGEKAAFFPVSLKDETRFLI
jgi:hypothetical protein